MKNILKKLRNPIVLRVLLVIFITLIGTGAVFYYLKTTDRVYVEDSLISAPVISLSTTTPGKIKNILVNEGQKVKKGDTLAIVGTEEIRAYTDGIITETNKQIGSIASAQTPVVKMININDIRADATIDENKGLNRVKVGQVVAFTVDALPGQTYWGFVDEIAPSAKQTQAAFSISSERATQQFDIYAHFDASNHPEIKNGMSAKMTIFTKN
jgi:multidrug resistance efflux pump